MGRPKLGFKLTLIGFSPETLKRIRRFTSNISAFVRDAVEVALKKAEKKAKKSKE